MAPTPIREPGTEDGWSVIDAATAAASRRLGTELVSVYAIGSLAHGGFSPAASDVDLALLLAGGSSADTERIVDAISGEVREQLGTDLAERLSIFHVPWGRFAAPPPGSRFPAIDRQDLVNHGVLVWGDDLRATAAPSPTGAEIIEQAIASALQRHTPERLAEEISELTVTGIKVREASKLVLWPIRLLHVAETGAATGNQDAVEHYGAVAGAAHTDLAQRALRWRTTGQVPDSDAIGARLTAELFPLHREVFERLSHRPRLPHTAELATRAEQFAVRVPDGGRAQDV